MREEAFHMFCVEAYDISYIGLEPPDAVGLTQSR